MPPIHTLILPSKIPLDLRLHFRDLDEELVVGRSRRLHFSRAHSMLAYRTERRPRTT